jgi:hypothetical protein
MRIWERWEMRGRKGGGRNIRGRRDRSEDRKSIIYNNSNI